jgi:hypothetical protein
VAARWLDTCRAMAANPLVEAALISSIVSYMLKTNDNPEGTDPSVFDKITQGITHDRATLFGDFFKQFFGVGMLAHPVSQKISTGVARLPCRHAA